MEVVEEVETEVLDVVLALTGLAVVAELAELEAVAVEVEVETAVLDVVLALTGFTVVAALAEVAEVVEVEEEIVVVVGLLFALPPMVELLLMELAPPPLGAAANASYL